MGSRGRLIGAALFGVTLVSPSTGAEPPSMADIPGGTFQMGSMHGPADERPVHPVHVMPFAIDRQPVTNAAFAHFLNQAGSIDARGRRYFDLDDRDARIERRDGRYEAAKDYADHPVVEPSWRGARAYCHWRNARLPTEAEWERAARGTNGRTYPWGDDPPDPTRARFKAGWNETTPAGSRVAGATPEGVLDLAGNVHEWTSSLYRAYPYRADDGREDPETPGERVTRGGGHDSPADELKAAWRGNGVSRAPRAGHHNIGFRCARSIR